MDRAVYNLFHFKAVYKLFKCELEQHNTIVFKSGFIYSASSVHLHNFHMWTSLNRNIKTKTEQDAVGKCLFLKYLFNFIQNLQN